MGDVGLFFSFILIEIQMTGHNIVELNHKVLSLKYLQDHMTVQRNFKLTMVSIHLPYLFKQYF